MKYEPVSGREMPRFSGIKTFFRLPHVGVKSDYDVALVGVPFDGGASYRPGSRFAASRVREISSLGRGYNWTRGEHIWSKLKVADVGDCSIVPISLEKSYAKIEKYFSDIVKAEKKFIAVGGDHSITLPILRALHKKYGPMSLIHFDAHLDTYPAAWDCEYHHGSFLRHAVDEKLVTGKDIYQIGLRGPLVDKNDLKFIEKHKINSTTMDDVRIHGLEAFLKKLPKIKGPAYLTFDIDCLDPVYAPGTGTPVVGGLTTYEVQRILRALQIKNLVGADIVEVSPPYDHADITSLAAVDVMFEALFLMAD